MSADEILGLMPSENPYVVEHGGFYRRWFSMVSDMAEFKSWVDQVKGTNEETWVPLWKKAEVAKAAQHDEVKAMTVFTTTLI